MGMPRSTAGGPNEVKYAVISLGATGDLVSAVSGKSIRVLGCALISAGTVNVNFEDNTTDISGVMPLIANSGFVLPYSEVGWCKTTPGNKLAMTLSGSVSVAGLLIYDEV